MDMKTAVSLPDDLYEAAERTAERLGIPRSRLFARALAEFIRTHSRESVCERLDAVYSGSPEPLDPDLAAAQSKAASDADPSW